MKKNRIPIAQFDLQTFLNRTIDSLTSEVSSEVDPTYAIVWVDRPGDVPVDGPESGRQLDAARKQEDERVPLPVC